MTLPPVHLADHAQWVAGAVGLRGVTGESLVGHVRVVLEWTQRFHDIDVSPLAATGQLCRQLCSPGSCLDERREVDVVRYPALLEVGGIAGHQLVADRKRGLRPVEEGPVDVLAACIGHRGMGAAVRTRGLPLLRHRHHLALRLAQSATVSAPYPCERGARTPNSHCAD